MGERIKRQCGEERTSCKVSEGEGRRERERECVSCVVSLGEGGEKGGLVHQSHDCYKFNIKAALEGEGLYYKRGGVY